MLGTGLVFLSNLTQNQLSQKEEEIVFQTEMIFIDTLSKCEQIPTSLQSFSLDPKIFLKWKKIYIKKKIYIYMY